MIPVGNIKLHQNLLETISRNNKKRDLFLEMEVTVISLIGKCSENHKNDQHENNFFEIDALIF